ncbi:protein white-like isoform X2 [Coccinella septempunctata]|uniref:protein white-like isoform X2 n=1 Tax=Coccinella septempunctata TaxID=41139 RepID=UPI001D07A35D|nr:protein white-like isoform X2 [Coccinella septempunctata]
MERDDVKLLENSFENSGSSSGNEYGSFRIPDAQLEAWKKRKNSPDRIEDPIPSAKQIKLSWSDLNAIGNFSSYGRNERPRHSITSMLQEDIYPLYEEKHILKNVSGVAYPAELLVILGPSGSGKTTLMNCITSRNLRSLNISGCVCLNGKQVHRKELAAKSAYVQQEDLFIGCLTVREHLMFQALLRIESRFSYEHKLDRVEKVISELSLTKCQDSQIGVPGVNSHLSGGERKRLALASELLTNPSILFCDEPTTGLDSFMALSVVHILKYLAQTGRTVIASLHQPSSELFTLFDKIYLMTDGKLAFAGNTEEAKEFFTQLKMPCPPKFNPADHYIQMISIIPGKEEICKYSTARICDAFENSTIGVRMKQQIQCKKSFNEFPWNENNDEVSPYKVSWCEQFNAVYRRSWLSLTRNPQVMRGRIIQMLFVCGLISVLFWQQHLNQTGVRNINGALFLILTNSISVNFLGVIFTFFDELPVFVREHKNGLYRTDIYYLSKIATDFPLYSIINSIGMTMCYFSIGLYPETSRWLVAVGFIILTPLVAMGIGYAVSIVATSMNEAFSLTALIMVPFILFSGIFVNIRSIPLCLRWLSDISWYRYGFEGLLINQWDGVKSIKCKNVTIPCPLDGVTILAEQGYSPVDFWDCVVLLILIAIITSIIPLIMLLYRGCHDE